MSLTDLVIEVTDSSFEEEVLQSELPVLVDYWAQWCNPCLMIAPVIEEIAKDYEGQIKVCKLNIETNTQTPLKFGIRAIPTLMIFKEGSLVATELGASTRKTIASFIDNHIG